MAKRLRLSHLPDLKSEVPSDTGPGEAGNGLCSVLPLVSFTALTKLVSESINRVSNPKSMECARQISKTTANRIELTCIQ